MGDGGRGGGRKWTGSLSQRARASRGLPPAVVKISSYSHSAGAVWDRVNYVGRDGELEVEGPNGEKLDQVQLEQRVEGLEWETEIGEGRQLSYERGGEFSGRRGRGEGDRGRPAIFPRGVCREP